MSDTIIIAGAPAQGKTPWIQNYIKNSRCFVFDIQNEYGQRTKYADQKPIGLSNNINAERSRYTGSDMKEFLRLCKTKRDTILVFEESTAFFRGKMNDLMGKHLIDRYHTGNVSILPFHSINRVPPEIFEMANYFVLFKTNDQEDTVYRKYRTIAQYFLDLQGKPDGSKHIIKLI